MVGRLVLLFSCFLLLASGALAAEPGLIGWWPLDEDSGTTALDISGNGNDGALIGETFEWMPDGGRFGGALSYGDVQTDYVEISTAGMSISAGTVAIWSYLAADQTSTREHYFFGHTTIPAFGSRIQLYMDVGDTDLDLGLGDAHTLATGLATLKTETWCHVALTWDNGQYVVYLDGEVIGNGTYAGLTALNDTAAIGNDGNTGGQIEAFRGLLDECRLYDRALSQDEIQAAMRTGFGFGTASDPIPASEAVDVPRDVALSWTAGDLAVTHDVYFGTAFDDVNDAGRDNSLEVLLSEGQGAVTYQPAETLDFGQTYYWRIDEVNGAPDYTVFKGQVWSFTAEPVAYPIESVVASTNVIPQGDGGVENTVNGSGLNELDQHSVEAPDMWLGVPSAEPITLQYEFDNVYKLHEMLVWNYNVQFELMLGFGVKDVTVEYSENGADWKVLGDIELAQATALPDYVANTTIDFGGVPAKFVKLTVNGGWGTLPVPQYGLSEVRFLFVPVQAREPQPADGAADMSVDATFAWRAGRDAVSHDLFFGADAEALVWVDTLDVASYGPDALELGATYYWRIDENQEAASWAGDLWSFATQAYLVVEDFEDYTDDIDAGEAIFLTWLDGYDMLGNGSTVGHLEAPFAETSVVNGGTQSMPLFFDNTGTATSEAQYTLAQDWTVGGIKSLSLLFHGAADNTGQLYVKINGTKVLYDGDAGDISRGMWQPWNIDLSAVGGNLSNVTSLIVGVEGAGASGVVYIDDIRLYPNAPESATPVEPDAVNLVASYAFDGNANDSSGNGHDGTIVGNITFVNDPVRSQVVSLPGGDDEYISIEGVGISGVMPRTIACWAKADNTSIPDWTLIFGFTGNDAGAGGNGSHFNIGSLGGPGGVGAHVWGWEETIFSDEEALEWHHYAMSYDGTTILYYGDGFPTDTDTAKSNVQDLSPSSDRVHVGSRITQTSSFPGKVDDAVIYSVALTDEEVAYLAGRRGTIHKEF